MNAIPVGSCQCGCGRQTSIAPYSWSKGGWVKGQPVNYVRGHRPSTPLAERFWRKVNKTGNCWLWTGRRHKNGYGRFSVRNVGEFLSHRLSWMLTNGPIPHGFDVCHNCDSRYEAGDISYRLCVRPDHLFLATHIENVRDCVAKKRHSMGKRHGSTHLTEEDVHRIRARAVAGERYSVIAVDYGIGYFAVRSIVKRLNWKHLF